MNGTNKTLEKLLTEFSQTADGFNFRVDSNGMIQDLTFDRNAFKLNSNLIEFNDGDVIIKDGRTTIKDAYIYKLTSDDAFIQNAEVTKLVSRDYRDEFKLEAGLMNWRRSDGKSMTFSLEDGIKYFNQDGSLRFQANQNLVISSAFGTSNSNVYLGARNGYEVRSVVFDDIPGDGAIDSYRYADFRGKHVYANALEANWGVDNATNIYLRPRAGGEIRVTAGQTVDTYLDLRARGLYATYLDYNSSHGSGSHIYLRPRAGGEIRVTALDTVDSYMSLRAHGFYGNFIRQNGGNNLYVGTTNEVRFTSPNSETTYKNVRGGWAYFNALDINSGENLYIRPASSGEVRFTAKGTTGTYVPIRFSEWTATSHEKYKHDIEEWNYNVLDIFKNDLKLHRYKFNSDLNTEYDRYRHGIIIRYDSNKETFPVEWRNGDGFDGNEVMWWNTKAIQELAYENDELKSEIKELNNKINKIMEMI